MSLKIAQSADIPGDALRDVSPVIADNANVVVDMVVQFRAVGMDAYLRNMAATAIEINFDGAGNITVGAGAVFIRNSSRYARVAVTAAAEAYELVLDGMLITTCQRRGWMPK